MTSNISKRPSYTWLPFGLRRVLDVGCAWGYDAARLLDKSEEVYGIDVNAKNILRAKELFPTLHLQQCGAENLPYQDFFFDGVILSEVLEHVIDENKTLNEIYRVLKPGGLLVLEVPHRGLFAFLDPANQKFYVKKYFPRAFKLFVARKLKHNVNYNPKLACGIHRHYSLAGIRLLLDHAGWKSGYVIKRIWRHGLVAGPLLGIIRAALRLFIGEKLIAKLLSPFLSISKFENRVSFGPLSYQLAILIQKQ